MAQSPADPDPFGRPDEAGADQPLSGAPRWVKLLGIVALVVVLLIVILLLTGGHGPGRHAASGHTGYQPPPVSITELRGAGGHERAADAHET